jgi:hypothetical protein
VLQQVAADAGLDGDHAHGMGQDVMQVAGDAGALLEHGPVGQLLAGRLQGGRLLLEGAGIAAPGGQHHPQHPAADEHDGHIADLQQVDVPDAGGRGGQHLERAQQGQGAPPQGPGGGADRDHGGQGGERLQQVGRVLERGPGRVGDAEAGHHQQRCPAQGQQGQDVGGQQGPAQPIKRPGVAGAGRRGEEDHAEDPGQPGVDGQRTIGTRHGLTLPATAGGGVGHPDDRPLLRRW